MAALGQAEAKQGSWSPCLEGDLQPSGDISQEDPPLPRLGPRLPGHSWDAGPHRPQRPGERTGSPGDALGAGGGGFGEDGSWDRSGHWPCVPCISPPGFPSDPGWYPRWLFSQHGHSFHVLGRGDCSQGSLILAGGTRPLHAFSGGLSWAQVTQGEALVVRLLSSLLFIHQQHGCLKFCFLP